MRIVHVLRDLSCNGGVQRLVVDCALQLKKDGCFPEIIVFNLSDGPSYVSELIDHGVPVHLFDIKKAFNIYKLARGADVIHAHLFPALYFVGLFFPGSFYTEHNTTNNRRSIALSKSIERIVYQRYKCVTCISPEVEESLIDFLGLGDKLNTVVVYNGVDLSRFSSRLPRNFKLCDQINVAMVGSLTEKKDQAALIQALTSLEKKYHLHLAGDGPNLRQLESLVEHLGLNERVHFHGIVTDLDNFLGKMDIYVQSSRWEGFGLAAVEAMASGLPVLCSNVPGLNNLFSSKDLLFNVGDATELASKIRRIVDDYHYYTNLREIGSSAVARYSIKNVCGEFLKLYRSSRC